MVKACLRYLFMLALIPLTLIAMLLTPTGFKISLAIVSKLVPGQLHYRQVTGTLLGPLSIRQIDYRYHGNHIVIGSVDLAWSPLALKHDQFVIEKVTINDINITLPASPTPAPVSSSEFKNIQTRLLAIRDQLTDWQLPIKLQIKQANINRIAIGDQPHQFPWQIAQINLHGILQSDKLDADIKAHLLQPYNAQIKLTLQGTPQQYDLQLSVANPDIHWIMTGKVNRAQIELQTQQTLIFNGQLNIHLVWQWTTPWQWQLTASGRHLDFSKFKPDWPHPIDVNVNTSGYFAEEHPYFSWDATLNTQKTKLETHGKRSQQWDVHWNINIAQLAELLPFSSGTIQSSGELHGSLSQPETTGTLKANLLRWQDYRLDNITANWDIDISEHKNSHFQLQANEFFTRFLHIDNAQANGQGKWANHQLSAKINAYQTQVTLAVAGGMATDHWSGALNQFSIIMPFAGTWQLTSPTALNLSPQKFDITALCLRSTTQSQLCLKAKLLEDNSWQASLTSKLNLEQLSSFTPSQYSFHIPIDVHATAQGIGKQIQQAQLTGAISAGYMRYSGTDQTLRTDIKGGTINARLDKSGAAGKFNLELADNNTVSAEFALPRASSDALLANNQALQGKLDIRFHNLLPLATFIPDIVNPTGKFETSLIFGGTVGQPIANGHASLEQGQVKIPGLNIQLNKLALTLQAHGLQTSYTLTGDSADKVLTLTGQTDLGQPGFPTQATLTGSNVLLVDTPQYMFHVSPNIHVILKGHTIDISGALDIPQGVIRQLELYQETTLPENEVVFIGTSPIKKATRWDMSTQLTVNLGDNVRVDAPGLRGRLTGSITLIGQPGQVMLGIGRINIIDGIYEVFGRQLTITPSSGIIYRRNPLNNPSLGIQAITQILVTDALSQQQLGTNELTVGMSIAGTSSSPQITLFSSAGNLSQADMLSYLLLGTSSANVSPTNMNLLLQALNTLPLTKKSKSGESITNQIKQGLGFSELGVESETTFSPTGEPIPTTGQTSYFVVGKKITSRIYLRYKYDPFNSVNLFRLNYLLSKSWSLQLETDGSTQTGADIIYTIEAGAPKTAEKPPATIPPPAK